MTNDAAGIRDGEQLDMRFDDMSPSPLPHAPDERELRDALAPATPTVVFSTYWRFAVERQNIFFRRLAGQTSPWTEDPILLRHKFTNAYRASDRVSQYLIQHVIYGARYAGQRTAEEVAFRVLLFKLFNRIETWERLEAAFGELTWRQYDYQRYAQVLDLAMSKGDRLYSAAYIMPAAPRPDGESRKHRSHLNLLDSMIRSGLVAQLGRTRSMQQGFSLLRSYPSIGDFLAYQFITDLNYTEFLNYSEMEFVIPGPGARDGIAKCFSNLGGLTESEIIRYVADLQNDMFSAHKLHFRSLWGRGLQLVDCQNLFCEVDKYSRVFHPDAVGRTGRTRIKQQFQPSPKPPQVWYPPKWGINERILTDAAGSTPSPSGDPNDTNRIHRTDCR